MPFQSIAVLGEGKTAKAVNDIADKLKVPIVPVGKSEVVIASPGIDPKQFPLVDVPIISEIEYAYLLLKQYSPQTTIIAVTGTNGKSTVTSLIAHLLRCPAVGNIGIPFISLISNEMTLPVVCVEVSSYQLETCQTFQPDIAVMLNMTEDHLARHGTMQNYAKQKQKLIQSMTPDQMVFYNASDGYVSEMVSSTEAQRMPFMSVSELAITLPQVWQVGHHSLNAVVGVMVARYYGVSDNIIAERLVTFQFLPHRLELAGNYNGRQFINDSKATNPSATLTAVLTFNAPVHLILCGEDKQLVLESFITKVSNIVKSITVFGEVSAIYEALLSESTIPVSIVSTLSEAVIAAYGYSSPGSVILFSPSSSSYDQFDGFEDRGDQFKAYIRKQYASGD